MSVKKKINGSLVSIAGNAENVPVATSNTKGIVQPDNSTITINNGILSAAAQGSQTYALRLVEDEIEPSELLSQSDLPITITSNYGGILYISSGLNSNDDIAVPKIDLPRATGYSSSMSNILGGDSDTGAMYAHSGSGSYSGDICPWAFNPQPLNYYGVPGLGITNNKITWDSTKEEQKVDLSTLLTTKYYGWLFTIPFASTVEISWPWSNATLRNGIVAYVYKYIPISGE